MPKMKVLKGAKTKLAEERDILFKDSAVHLVLHSLTSVALCLSNSATSISNLR